MPTTIPALHGKFGTTEYWLTTMNAGELVRNALFPHEIEGWKDLTIEEKYQREMNFNRVRREIAPYFANDPDRFSGAVVLAVMDRNEMEFTPLQSVLGNVKNPAYHLFRSAAKNIGFLTLQGNETLVPLDGQHRIKAFKFAMEGADEKGNAIAGTKANQDIAGDDVAVILIRFEPKRARQVFNKLNRYAKPTAKGDNLITDDDDAVAVITRELIGDNGIMRARVVRTGGNALSGKAREFTTLATLYEANMEICNNLKLVDAAKKSPKLMDEDQRELAKEQVLLTWTRLISRIDEWRTALADQEEKGDETRINIREQTLLGKPVGQRALISGYMTMREKCGKATEEELCERLNRIDWSVGNPTWKNVLIRPDNKRVITGTTAIRTAGELIAHLGGAKLSRDETQRLLENIYGKDGWKNHKLPEPVA